MFEIAAGIVVIGAIALVILQAMGKKSTRPSKLDDEEPFDGGAD